MKRLGGVWVRVTAFDNLYQAYLRARRGKRDRPAVRDFEFALEAELLQLQAELSDGGYRPGGYRLFQIYDRKPRLIAAAPFRDRVAHHAVMGVIEPTLDRRFIHDSYACRVGKGVHAAVRRYQQWARTHAYVLKLDVSRYFPSIDHGLLKAKLRRRIKDVGVLNLLDRMIDSAPSGFAPPVAGPSDDLVDLMQRGRGLPIGNLTSQFFGNLYLNDLDHYLKQACGVRAYLRYVDDLVLLHDDKNQLWRWRDAIAEFLLTERLMLHPRKTQVQPVGLGLNLLGYRVWPWRVRLQRDSGYRYRKRLRGLARGYALGRVDLEDVRASVAAWLGHVNHAESLGLRRAVLGSVSFRRGCAGTRPARGSRRWLEQPTGEPACGEPQQEHHR